MGIVQMWKTALPKLDVWDIGLIKLSSMAFILFVITIWPAAMDLMNSINTWWFLVAAVILGARPFYRAYMKKGDMQKEDMKKPKK